MLTTYTNYKGCNQNADHVNAIFRLFDSWAEKVPYNNQGLGLSCDTQENFGAYISVYLGQMQKQNTKDLPFSNSLELLQ